jgi:hypothetical protein
MVFYALFTQPAFIIPSTFGADGYSRFTTALIAGYDRLRISRQNLDFICNRAPVPSHPFYGQFRRASEIVLIGNFPAGFENRSYGIGHIDFISIPLERKGAHVAAAFQPNLPEKGVYIAKGSLLRQQNVQKIIGVECILHMQMDQVLSSFVRNGPQIFWDARFEVPRHSLSGEVGTAQSACRFWGLIFHLYSLRL